MKTWIKLAALSVGLVVATASFAEAPANAPAGTTGLCKDGTFYSGDTKKGACRGHQGVKDWYGATAAPAAAAAPTPVAAPAALPPAASAPMAPPKPTSAAKSKFTPPAMAAAGGGPGLVWVNASSKVYHCQGDKWYGKTKHGEYLSEADAKGKSFKGNHGKGCQ